MATDDDEQRDVASSRVAQVEQLLEERDRLIHDLEVHQVELEAQNQQLRDAQDLLEESQARYADLYDFAPVGYCTLDLAGCIAEINLTGAGLLGTPRGHLIGKPFAVFVLQDDRAAFRAHLQDRRLSPEGTVVVEVTLARHAPQPLVIQMVSTVAQDRSGAVVGCRSAFTDISEQKRAEEALRFAVRMREDFLAIVSHDLRNPLNSIALGSEILLTSPSLDAKTVTGLGNINRAAARMGRMLGDLLDLSSMDAGHLSMERRTETVAGLLSTMVESAAAGAAERAVRLETVLDAPHLVAFCDRDRVLQVLTNLVDNAIKFTGRGGVVRVEARQRLEQIELVVRDTGPGMVKSDLDHIFDPYWQVAMTGKKGTGLGLSIAKGIVEFHGGRIWVESQVGRGTAFHFTLPTRPIQEASPQATSLRPRSRTGPLSGSHRVAAEPTEASRAEPGPILIVDDDLDTRELLTVLLRREGYVVATAADGASALAYLREATLPPFLILLDLVMPGMDGWQFLEERSRDARIAGIPVVLISGQVAARETARALGVANYVEKPIAAASLIAMLARMRDRPASTA